MAASKPSLGGIFVAGPLTGIAVAVKVLLLGLSLVGCAGSNELMPGAAGIGDPYYETLGNGGYDVDHYTIELDVEPETNVITGTTTIVAHATQPLSSFNLDLAGLVVDDIIVDGRAADYGREGYELTVTPAEPVLPNGEFTAEVTYHGSP